LFYVIFEEPSKRWQSLGIVEALTIIAGKKGRFAGDTNRRFDVKPFGRSPL
jgi:hypothetical protein